MKLIITKPYETDASRLKGKCAGVLFPTSIAEARNMIAISPRIVPRGGGTGLSGGAVPQGGLDVVLDLSKLNKIGKLDKERGTVEVEAGVILDNLQDYLEEFHLEFPVNPSSHAVATIGGMIATDAVGNRAMKYGKTSNWVRWVEVIDGEGKLTRKSATELSDYSGMEGITGVIVKACLKLSPRKKRTATLISFKNIGEITEKIKELKRDVDVSMAEFLDKFISNELGLGEDYHLIIEYENDSGNLSGEKYESLLAKRDMVYPLLGEKGYTKIEDPKIFIYKFFPLMRWLEENQIPTFGNLSVGILHPCFNEEKEPLVPEMMKLVKKLSGQVSGEHGIGLLKKQYVEENDKKILINVKKRTDPLNKFNVGKII